MGKKALVLGGGGAKGAYQIGVWKAFIELGINFDIITGTSVGALNGALMVQGDYDIAEKLWDSAEFENVFKNNNRESVRDIATVTDMVKFALANPTGEKTMDMSPLEEILDKEIDEKKVRDSLTDFGLVVVEFPNLRHHQIMKQDIQDGSLNKFLMASSSCFPVTAPYEIDGVKYIDGAYYDNLPINLAIENGATEITTVDIEGIGLVKRPKKRDLQVTYIRPYWDLGAIFDFEQSGFERNKKLGYYDALKMFGWLEGYCYTFETGEMRSNYQRYEEKIPALAFKIRRIMKSPAAKAIKAIGGESAIVFLSREKWGKIPERMFCRVAELAGEVFEIPPENKYRFKEFNDLIISEYERYKNEALPFEEYRDDILQLSYAFTQMTNVNKKMMAAIIIAELLKTDSAHIKLAELFPKEYCTALYLNLLLYETNNETNLISKGDIS